MNNLIVFKFLNGEKSRNSVPYFFSWTLLRTATTTALITMMRTIRPMAPPRTDTMTTVNVLSTTFTAKTRQQDTGYVTQHVILLHLNTFCKSTHFYCHVTISTCAVVSDSNIFYCKSSVSCTVFFDAF